MRLHFRKQKFDCTIVSRKLLSSFIQSNWNLFWLSRIPMSEYDTHSIRCITRFMVPRGQLIWEEYLLIAHREFLIRKFYCNVDPFAYLAYVIWTYTRGQFCAVIWYVSLNSVNNMLDNNILFWSEYFLMLLSIWKSSVYMCVEEGRKMGQVYCEEDV